MIKTTKSTILPTVGFLLIDEGSQMHFPDLLSLTTLLTQPPFPSTLLVAGDHRQLAAINSHDFDSDVRV